MSLGQKIRAVFAKAGNLKQIKPKAETFATADIAPNNEAQAPIKEKKKFSLKGFLILLLLLLIPIYYMLGAMLTHRINDDLNFKVGAPSQGKSITVEVVAGLIDREVNDTKWAPNTQPFEPAALLRFGGNMVNFQSGIIRSLSTIVFEMENRLARMRGTSSADPDMASARQGLSRSPETWILDPLPTSSADSEYKKAREALLNYNKRLASGQAVFEVRADNLQAVLDRIALDLGGMTDALEQQTLLGRKVIIDRRADKLFYYAKGQSYAYFIVLRALREDYMPILKERRIESLYAAMLTDLAMVADMHPLIVQNAKPDGAFLPNHLSTEGFYILRARAKLREITDILQR